MKWRRISENEVRETVISPEKIEETIKGRKNAYKHVNNKWLKVTFKEEFAITIITAIDKNE